MYVKAPTIEKMVVEMYTTIVNRAATNNPSVSSNSVVKLRQKARKPRRGDGQDDDPPGENHSSIHSTCFPVLLAATSERC